VCLDGKGPTSKLGIQGYRILRYRDFRLKGAIISERGRVAGWAGAKSAGVRALLIHDVKYRGLTIASGLQ